MLKMEFIEAGTGHRPNPLYLEEKKKKKKIKKIKKRKRRRGKKEKVEEEN
jgi:hypothetical protein